MTDTTQPLVSIDVVPFRYDAARGQLLVTLGARLFEPFKGALALPGVLLGHERVDDAARRALRTKVGVEGAPVLRDVGVFDNPDRDPRGPTLSITKLAAVAPPSPAEHLTVAQRPVEEARGLPFDHDAIVRRAAVALSEKLWADKDLTRSLMGESFTSRDALMVQRRLNQVVGPDHEADLNASNMQRRIRSTGWVRRAGTASSSSAKGGRPPVTWAWI